MKLNDALRKLCLEHGNIIVQKKNLVYLLSDMGAFEELPTEEEPGVPPLGHGRL